MTNEMTAKEAVKQIKGNCYFASISEKTKQALDMAIKALEQQHDVHNTCIEDYPTCTECEHYDSEKHYCPRFCQVIKDTLAEAQSTDAVSREAVVMELDKYLCGVPYEKGIDKAIKELPSVTPQRPKGKWIIIDDCELFMAKCSECGEIVDSRMINKYPYCHCGAEMSGGGEDEG